MARGRHPAGQLIDRRRAADLLELAVLAQRFSDGQMVDLAVALEQLPHRGKHGAVLLAIEVLGPELLLDQECVQVPLVQQHGPEDRLLSLEIMRRNGDLLGDAHGDPSLGLRAASARGPPRNHRTF